MKLASFLPLGIALVLWP